MSKSTGTLARGLALLVASLPLSGTSWADPPSPPPPPALTLEAALSAARQRSPLAAAARLRIGEAQGDLTGASVLLVNNPELAAEAGPRIAGSAGSGATADLAVTVEQRFETGGQRRHRIDRARAKVEAATASAEDVQRVIDLAVARTFYRALAADLRQQLLGDNERLARELYEVARRRLDAGEGTLLEVNTARIRLAEAQRRTLSILAERQAAAVRLAELMGLAPSTQIVLRGDLPGDEAATAPMGPSAMNALVARAVGARPDLAATARKIDAARAAMDLADSEVRPDVGVGVSFGHEGGENIVTAGVRVPIPLFNRNQGARERTRATQRRLIAQREALTLSVVSEVRRALLAYEQARSALQIYNADVLRAQDESLALLKGAFEAGDIGIADVITVQRQVVEGREGYLDARLDLALARAAALASAGMSQTDTLQGDAQ